jgi:oligo-1,6-glucosidase
MTNVAYESISDYNDLDTINRYRRLVEEQGVAPEAALAAVQPTSRDNARTPMQWSAAAQAGFTTGTPWLKVNPRYTEINVEQALENPGSVFYHYQKLIALRKAHPALVYGKFELLPDENELIFAYRRALEAECLLVVLNLGEGDPLFKMTGVVSKADLLIANCPVRAMESESLRLRPYEAHVYKLNKRI